MGWNAARTDKNPTGLAKNNRKQSTLHLEMKNQPQLLDRFGNHSKPFGDYSLKFMFGYEASLAGKWLGHKYCVKKLSSKHIWNCIIMAQSDYKALKSIKELESKDNVVAIAD